MGMNISSIGGLQNHISMRREHNFRIPEGNEILLLKKLLHLSF
jgi:hypothetical protein